MVLGSTQSLTEIVPRIFPGGKGGRCVGLTTIPPSCADVLKTVSLKLQEPSGPVKACNGIALPLLYCLEIWEPQTPGTLRVC
jgi:hypothetical protein